MGSAAIITGGGRGIGRAITLRLARDGPVVVVGRTAADLEAVCGECARSGGSAVACAGDVAEPGTAGRAIAAAGARGWKVGHLVCNAGIGKGGPSEKLDAEVWRQTFETNVHGAFHLIRAGLPEMLREGAGAITIISSLGGTVGLPYDAAYSASKHALVGLARSLHLEYRKRGLTVVALCPSFVDSDMTRRTIRGVMRRHGLAEAEAERRVAERCPAGRILPAEEIAEAVALIGAGRLRDAAELAARGGYPLVPAPEGQPT